MQRLASWLVPALFLALLSWPAPAGDSDEVKPINLDKLNTEADEVDPFLAPDNTTLLYASNKEGRFDVLVSRKVGATWPAGKPLFASKDADERSPFIHKNTSYYASNSVPDPKLADLKNFDIFQKPGMLAANRLHGVSEPTDELHPWITPGGTEFYFSRKTDDGWVLFVARGPNPGPIGDAKPVGFSPGYHNASLASNGLSMYLEGPLDDGRTGIFRSKRARAGAEWSEPEPLTALNDSEGKVGNLSPSLSADGQRLFFASDRPGGKGGLDIWYVPTKQLK